MTRPRGRSRDRRRRTLVILAILAVTGGCGGADTRPDDFATIEPGTKAQIRDLASIAQTIMVGRVTSIELRRTVETAEETLRFDEVVLSVEESLKGATAGEPVHLEQVETGGRAIPGFEPYRIGGRYLLFLRPSETEPGLHVALPAGRYLVAEERVEALSAESPDVGSSWDKDQFLSTLRAVTSGDSLPDPDENVDRDSR